MSLTVEAVTQRRPAEIVLQRATRRLHGKAVIIGLLAVGSYAGLVFVANGPLLAVPLACVLIVALIATGTCVMHDANHGAFGVSRRVNMVLSYSGDMLGANSWLWRQKHNVMHHGNTNVVGIDTDIEQMPYARLAPDQPWKPWHRYQHIYIWALYGFLTLQWMLWADFEHLVTGHIGSQPMRRKASPSDLALLGSGKLAHLGWAVVLPMFFHRWWMVLAFYVACSWVVGFVLAVFFQVAHCVDNTTFGDPSTPRRGDDFVAHQLRTTANVGCDTPVIGPSVAWLMGGLHHQIEHHLAPGLPHTSYPDMAEGIKDLCAATGTDYRVHPSLWAAMASHTRWLRAMGAPPTAG